MQNPCLGELAQPLGEHVGADPGQTGQQIGESLRAQQKVSNHQQCPPLADQIKRVSHRAALVIPASTRHGTNSTRTNWTIHLYTWYYEVFSCNVGLVRLDYYSRR